MDQILLASPGICQAPDGSLGLNSSQVGNPCSQQPWVSRCPQGHGMKGKALLSYRTEELEAEGTILGKIWKQRAPGLQSEIGVQTNFDCNSPRPQSPPVSLMLGKNIFHRAVPYVDSWWKVLYLLSVIFRTPPLAPGTTTKQKQSPPPWIANLCSRPYVKAFTYFSLANPHGSPIS